EPGVPAASGSVERANHPSSFPEVVDSEGPKPLIAPESETRPTLRDMASGLPGTYGTAPPSPLTARWTRGASGARDESGLDTDRMMPVSPPTHVHADHFASAGS